MDHQLFLVLLRKNSSDLVSLRFNRVDFPFEIVKNWLEISHLHWVQIFARHVVRHLDNLS